MLIKKLQKRGCQRQRNWPDNHLRNDTDNRIPGTSKSERENTQVNGADKRNESERVETDEENKYHQRVRETVSKTELYNPNTLTTYR